MIPHEYLRINNRFKTKNGNTVYVTSENIIELLKSSKLLEPMDLTSDFLESQGVEKDPMFKNVYRMGKLEFVDRGEVFFVYYDKMKLKEISCVHEFQDLIWCLIQSVGK